MTAMPNIGQEVTIEGKTYRVLDILREKRLICVWNWFRDKYLWIKI